MDFQTYRPLALRTAKLFPSSEENLTHAALGLITEIGEFTTEVKRIFAYGRPMTEEMRLHMVEEIGDAMWYLPLGLAAVNAGDAPSVDPAEMEALPINTLEGLSMSLHMLSATVSAHLFDPDRIDGELMGECLVAIAWIIDTAAPKLLGVTGDEIRAQNIAKLRLRYPDKYSDEAAEARADKGGADARSS